MEKKWNMWRKQFSSILKACSKVHTQIYEKLNITNTIPWYQNVLNNEISKTVLEKKEN